MNENELTAKLLAEHYQKGREELAQEIIKTIIKRKDRQNIGTLTRIYSWCKKQIKVSDVSVSKEVIKNEWTTRLCKLPE